VSATPEPDPFIARHPERSVKRLTPFQRLTLNVWRHAVAAINRQVPPDDVFARAAIHAVVAVVRDTTDPLELFDRHDNGANEYDLVVSIAGDRGCNDVLNLIDGGYLLRWQELTAEGPGPEELPPLRPWSGPERLFP
jgi:hypothetical protein